MADPATRRVPEVAATEWLRALPPCVRFSFFGDARAREDAMTVWDVGFSDTACRATANAKRASLWLGPDEYLLLDFGSDLDFGTGAVEPAALFASLEQAMAGTPHALVDVSHRQFTLEVSGPHAATLLNGACPLDLDLGEFPVGMCTRTVLAKADIVLWRTRPDAFQLEVWRSFAGYVTGILGEIAREFTPTA